MYLDPPSNKANHMTSSHYQFDVEMADVDMNAGDGAQGTRLATIEEVTEGVEEMDLTN